jgi:exodeoxyribonuclease V alpha subunit
MAEETIGYREIDRIFADFLCRLAGGGDETLRRVALEVSRVTGEGHICLDLAEAYGEDAAEAAALLSASSVVGTPGEVAPLILDRDKRVYLFRYWKYENRLAGALRAMAAYRPSGADVELQKDGITRLFGPPEGDGPDWQRIAAAAALRSRFTVVSGGPGTGKTTTVVKIIALLLEQARGARCHIALAAPTGKAAARLREAIRTARERLREKTDVLDGIPDDVSTIHRLLGVIPGSCRFRHDAGNPLPHDIVVVDEASMVALPLMAKLVAALSGHARLILLGDRDQLASVEPGAVLGDICRRGGANRFSPEFRAYLAEVTGSSPECAEGVESLSPLADSLVVLRKNYRFGSAGAIGVISRAVNDGDAEAVLRELQGPPGREVVRSDVPPAESLAAALEASVLQGYREYLEKEDPAAALAAFDRFRILCAVRRGSHGVSGLNRAVEGILASRRLIAPDRAWYRGRPVMVTVNDYAVRLFNGDIGITLPDPDRPDALAVFFPAEKGGVRKVSPLRLPEHETVFAMTVHKSQGSEFDRVLLVMPPADNRLVTRELLYTGITRARESVVLWCGEESLRAAVCRRVDRRSGLQQALWGGYYSM